MALPVGPSAGTRMPCRDKSGRRPVELATKDTVVQVLAQALKSSQVCVAV